MMNEETAALDHYSIKLLIIKEIPLLLLKLLLWRLNSTRFLGVHVTDNLLQCQSSPAPALPTEAKKDSSQPIRASPLSTESPQRVLHSSAT